MEAVQHPRDFLDARDERRKCVGRQELRAGLQQQQGLKLRSRTTRDAREMCVVFS